MTEEGFLRHKIIKKDQEIKQFQEALEFYADEKNWQDKLDYWGSTVERAKIKTDGGEIARTALHPENLGGGRGGDEGVD